jgi:hypothetical protein
MRIYDRPPYPLVWVILDRPSQQTCRCGLYVILEDTVIDDLATGVHLVRLSRYPVGGIPGRVSHCRAGRGQVVVLDVVTVSWRLQFPFSACDRLPLPDDSFARLREWLRLGGPCYLSSSHGRIELSSYSAAADVLSVSGIDQSACRSLSATGTRSVP